MTACARLGGVARNGRALRRAAAARRRRASFRNTEARCRKSSRFELANYAQPEDPPEVVNGKEINFCCTVFAQSANFGRLIEVDSQSSNVHFSAIRQAAAQGHFVVAYLHHHHWEPDWQDIPRWVETFACVDAGADLFVSHGAPVLQAMEIYNGSPILYGLGIFLFHAHPTENEWDPPEVWEASLLLAATVLLEELRRSTFCPL